MTDSGYCLFDIERDWAVLTILYMFRTGICTFDPGFTSTGMQQ